MRVTLDGAAPRVLSVWLCESLEGPPVASLNPIHPGYVLRSEAINGPPLRSTQASGFVHLASVRGPAHSSCCWRGMGGWEVGIGVPPGRHPSAMCLQACTCAELAPGGATQPPRTTAATALLQPLLACGPTSLDSGVTRRGWCAWRCAAAAGSAAACCGATAAAGAHL